jgi:hypothetical protein
MFHRPSRTAKHSLESNFCIDHCIDRLELTKNMFKLTILLATLLSVAAFAPSARMSMRSTHKLAMGFENDVGVLPPTGFWDPLGEVISLCILF